MRRPRLLFTLAFAVLLGALFVTGVGLIAAQDGPTFQGAETCYNCHRGIANHYTSSLHNFALQSNADGLAGTVANFSAGEDIREVTFPGEGERVRKEPFHMPRYLMMGVDVLKKLAARQ